MSGTSPSTCSTSRTRRCSRRAWRSGCIASRTGHTTPGSSGTAGTDPLAAETADREQQPVLLDRGARHDEKEHAARLGVDRGKGLTHQAAVLADAVALSNHLSYIPPL